MFGSEAENKTALMSDIDGAGATVDSEDIVITNLLPDQLLYVPLTPGLCWELGVDAQSFSCLLIHVGEHSLSHFYIT